MKLNTYVTEKIEGLFEDMATSISAGDVQLDDFTKNEYPAVASALMLDTLPATLAALIVSLSKACRAQ